MTRIRLQAFVGAGALAVGLSLTVASPASAGVPECQTAARDNLPQVAAADAEKACQKAAKGDVDGCVEALQKAAKGKAKVDEGVARGACIAAQY